MLFKDFIASIDDEKILEQMHAIMRNHFCFNHNIQCMVDSEEYFNHLEHVNNDTYVAETEDAGIYIAYHRGNKVMVIDFTNGTIQAVA